jgi:branched-chain amino acid transport system substrate-binding protein
MKNPSAGRRQVLQAGGALAASLAFPAIVRSQAKEVTIAGILPLTGPSAAFGQGSWNALQLACEAVNQKGGIKSLGGAQLRAAVADTESKPEVAASQTEQMIRRGASVLIGCNQSAAAIVASQVAERGSVPFMTAYDIDPAITARGFRYTFRLSPLVNSFANDLLAYVKQLGEKNGKPPRRVALLSEGSILGQSANKFATEAAQKLGLQIVDVATYDVGKTQNFTPYIAKYKGENVEVLVGHQRVGDAVLTVRTMKELGYNPAAYGGILGAQASGDYIQNLGKDADNTLSTDAWAPSLDIPGMKEVADLFQKRYGKPMDVSTAAIFSDVAVIVDSLERGKDSSPKALREHMAKTELKLGERGYFLLRGVKFNNIGDNDRASGLVSVIRNGTWVPVAPQEIAKGEASYPKPAWS